MKTYLTPQLLGFLIERGFTYCLSKTIITGGTACEIILTPLKAEPGPEDFSAGYDSCYKITREPFQMAAGLYETEVYINLD